MKLSAPVSSIFLLQPCRAYRHDFHETGLLISGYWFEPTPATDQRVRTILKTRHEIACQKSQGRPSQMKEGAESEPVHITGQATVALTEDNRNRKRSAPPALLV